MVRLGRIHRFGLRGAVTFFRRWPSGSNDPNFRIWTNVLGFGGFHPEHGNVNGEYR